MPNDIFPEEGVCVILSPLECFGPAVICFFCSYVIHCQKLGFS